MKKIIISLGLLLCLAFVGVGQTATRTQLKAFMTKINTALATNQTNQERLHAEARLLKAKAKIVQAGIDGVGTTYITLTLPTAAEIEEEMKRYSR